MSITMPVLDFVRTGLRKMVARGYWSLQRGILCFPQHVECNICGWRGRAFASDAWHEGVICPKCRADVRQRLVCAALEFLPEVSFRKLLEGKRILHFAPETGLRKRIRAVSGSYVTADISRSDCDLTLDVTHMPTVQTASFDAVILLDVLEHVSNYGSALREVYRCLDSNGVAIITVPQKDNLPSTYEDGSIVTPEMRERAFGIKDHLRIFGDDFTDVLESYGFAVRIATHADLAEFGAERFVLKPRRPSKRELATNSRRVFFATRVSIDSQNSLSAKGVTSG